MSATARKYLLVADDYDDAASLMASLLTAVADYDTASAKDGQQALEMALVRRPDVCLLDIDMPRIDGIEAARRLHDAFGDSCPVLIAMTGGPRRTEAAESGLFHRALTKPIDLLQLLDAIGESPVTRPGSLEPSTERRRS